MTAENIIENYQPEESFIEISERESPRFQAERHARVKAAHPTLSDDQVGKLITRAWLDVSMEYDKHYLSYVNYVDRMNHWVDVFSRATTSDLLDVIALFEEAQTLR